MSTASPSINSCCSEPCDSYGSYLPQRLWRKCANGFVAWMADEDGTTAVEYAVMVSMIAAFLIVSVGLMTQAAEESFTNTSIAIGS